MRKLSILCAMIMVFCMLAGACSAPTDSSSPPSQAGTSESAAETAVTETQTSSAAAEQSAAAEEPAEVPDATASVSGEAAAASEQTADGPVLDLEEPKALVAFFSVTGRTKAAAEGIAEATHAKLFQIEPAEPYTEADRAYEDENSRSNKEYQDQNARPAIVNEPDDIRQYSVVYLGYPIWYGSAPRIISTFLEENDLNGMKVIPFCTSGGSSIAASEEELRAQFPDVDWQPGKRIEDPEQDAKMAEWSDELGFWPFGE